MSEEIPFLDHLGDQLRRAEGPPRPDRRPLLRGVGVAAVLALAVVALTTFRSDPVAAGVDVRRVGNRVQLRVEGTAPPAAEIEEIAHRNGLDIRITEVPAGPSEVGQMFVAETTMAGPPDVRFGPNDAPQVQSEGFAVISFPVNWKGRLDLVIGRPARAGEDQYWHTSNGMARGEVLACTRGATADEVAAEAARKDVQVRWWVHEPDGRTVRREVPFDPAWTAQGLRAAYVLAIGPRSAIVELTPGGRVVEPRSFARFPSC